MNAIFDQKPLLKTGVFALLLLPCLILINSYSPPKEKIPEGYNSSILAFEFASDADEIKEVLGPLTQEERDDLDRLNYVDFGFMLLYGVFLYLFVVQLSELNGDEALSRIRWVVPVAVLADVLENVQLLKLTELFPELGSQAMLACTLLAVFTWIKWILLALVFAFAGRSLMKMTPASKVAGLLLMFPILLAIATFITSQRMIEDLFATSVFGAFFIVFIYCLLYKRNLGPSIIAD